MKRRYSAKVGNRIFSFGGRMRTRKEVAEGERLLRSPVALAILRKLVEGLEIGMDLSGKPNFGQKAQEKTQSYVDRHKEAQENALLSIWAGDQASGEKANGRGVLNSYFGGDA